MSEGSNSCANKPVKKASPVQLCRDHPSWINAPQSTDNVNIINIAKAPENDLIAKFGPSAVSAILVIAGWIVVNKLQANRERRKQARERIAELRKDLSELETKVIAYHTLTRDKALESDIIARLSRFEKACASLGAYCGKWWKFSALKESAFHIPAPLVQQLRQTMTLKHFQDEHAAPLEHEDPIVQHINLASDDLQDALEKCRASALD